MGCSGSKKSDLATADPSKPQKAQVNNLTPRDSDVAAGDNKATAKSTSTKKKQESNGAAGPAIKIDGANGNATKQDNKPKLENKPQQSNIFHEGDDQNSLVVTHICIVKKKKDETESEFLQRKLDQQYSALQNKIDDSSFSKDDMVLVPLQASRSRSALAPLRDASGRQELY
jgi:hypothetical protein